MRNLHDIIADVKGISIVGSTDKQIHKLCLDSRLVSEASLFAAMTGTQTNGHDYIEKAIELGAVAILCEKMPESPPEDVCFIICQDSQETLGQIAASYFGNPSQSLELIGITGTNGKTTIATWLYYMLRDMGYPAGILSTIRILIEGREYPATHTTPDVISLNSYLAKMVDAGCQYAVMEVSSHALEQKRISGIRFRGGIFTNLTRDHLDYHPDFASYIAAKKMLFDALPSEAFALVNSDDKHASIMIQNSVARKLTYASRVMADYSLKIMEQHPQGMSLQINGRELWVRIMGRYNALNMLAVFAAACELNLPEDEILESLSKLEPVEGRLEMVDMGRSVTAVVDYAHTPDALENVLQALNETKTEGCKIITAIGAGGDRDPGKRPKMAQAACAFSHQVILTSDNPRSEDPEKIIEDMAAGLTDNDQKKVLRIVNRREAIRTAIALAQSGDLILIAGKGHESYQEVKGVKHPFDDVEELKNLRS